MRVTASRNHPAGDRQEIVVPGVEHPLLLGGAGTHRARCRRAVRVNTGCRTVLITRSARSRDQPPTDGRRSGWRRRAGRRAGGAHDRRTCAGRQARIRCCGLVVAPRRRPRRRRAARRTAATPGPTSATNGWHRSAAVTWQCAERPATPWQGNRTVPTGRRRTGRDGEPGRPARSSTGGGSNGVTAPTPGRRAPSGDSARSSVLATLERARR